MQKLILFFVLNLPLWVFAQSTARTVIGSAGGVATGTNLSVSYTAGEVITATLNASNILFTEGFQQPSSNTSAIHNAEAGFSVNLYPNPTADGLINIDFTSDKNLTLEVKIYNAEGKQMTNLTPLQLNQTNIYPMDLSSLSKGQYFLKLQDKTGKSINSLSFIKTN